MGAAAKTTKPAGETWRDWLPPNAPEPALLTREELLAELRAQGLDDVTERSLRYWENQGVLPRPVQQKRDGTFRAIYPRWYPRLVEQVRRLQRHGYSLQEIRLRLRRWFDSPHTQAALHDFPKAADILRRGPHPPPEVWRAIARHCATIEEEAGIAVIDATLVITDALGRTYGYTVPATGRWAEWAQGHTTDSA